MSREINLLMLKIEQLRRSLHESWEITREASSLATELGGEFEQEISTDLDGIHVKLGTLKDELDNIMDEAKALTEDFGLMEESMRAGINDEENYKVDAEHIQEEMREDKEP